LRLEGRFAGDKWLERVVPGDATPKAAPIYCALEGVEILIKFEIIYSGKTARKQMALSQRLKISKTERIHFPAHSTL
jgi:hypothetical protein